MRDLARLAHIAGADGVMMIGEVWTASDENIPASGFAVDAPKRGEAINLHAATAQGESFVMSAKIERKRPGSKKVKSVSRAEIDEDGFPFISPLFRAMGLR